MTYQDLKFWVEQMTEEELARQLTPYDLFMAVDNGLAKDYESLLSWLFIFAPVDWLKDEAIRLLVLMHVPIRG